MKWLRFDFRRFERRPFAIALLVSCAPLMITSATRACLRYWVERQPNVLLAIRDLVDRHPEVFQLASNAAIRVGEMLAVLGISIIGTVLFFGARLSEGAVSRPGLITPPGARIRRILEFAYAPRSYTRVFEPALADMQTEWLEAMIRGEKWKAVWIRLRGYAALLSAVGLHGVVKTLEPIVRLFLRAG